MSNTDRKAKMATPPGAPIGVELDEKGNLIPFEKRTKGDKEKIRDHIAEGLHKASPTKNLERDADNPAPMGKLQ